MRVLDLPSDFRFSARVLGVVSFKNGRWMGTLWFFVRCPPEKWQVLLGPVCRGSHRKEGKEASFM